LGRATNRLDLAVPALLKSLESTNTLVACSAVWALEWASRPFEAHGEEIISALEVASERKDNVGGYAKIAATRWQERLRKN
jgi:hypothetical protein